MGAIDTIIEGPAGLLPQGKRDYIRSLTATAGSFVNWVAWRLEVRKSRRALLELTDVQLADIGISRCDAYREGIRSFLD